MNKRNWLTRMISLGICIVLILGIYQETIASTEALQGSNSPMGRLTAIDISLEAKAVLDRLSIRYQEQPRFGFWRAAATDDQLRGLEWEGISYSVAGHVAIVEGSKDQTSQVDGIDAQHCVNNNSGNYLIPINPTWVYDPIFTNCAGATTVEYVDIYYDVIHPWADNALYLNLGSSNPSWSYTNLESMDSCSAPASPDWHKYLYNITAFNGRPVNNRWDLVASDGCSGAGGPTGYIDQWWIWVYYSPPPHMVSLLEPFLSPVVTVNEDDRDDYNPAIAYNSIHHEYLVVWDSTGPGGFTDVYAQRISSSGQLLSWFAVGTYPESKITPSVAYDRKNDRYLVVWSYDVTGTKSDWDIYGRFIPWDGPDPGITEFYICNWSSNQLNPVVTYAYSQQEFMVVWQSYSSGVPNYISGRRVFADMSGMSADFPISFGSTGRSDPDVAYNLARNEYLVVWDVGPSGTQYDIFGRRLRGDGVPLGEEFAIAGWPDYEVVPSVAACDKADQYLVAWQSDHGTGLVDYAIYARYVNGDAIPGNVYLIDNTTNPEKNVDVTCNDKGTQYLLAWKSMYAEGYYGIWARIAYPNETLMPQFGVIDPGLAEERDHPVTGGGWSDYLVVWEHERPDGIYDTHGRLVRYAHLIPFVNK